MSDWRADQNQLHAKMEAEIRQQCAGKYAFADMFHAVAKSHILPKIGQMGEAGHLHPITVEGLDLRIVKVWNSLMPDHVPSEDVLEARSEPTWAWIAFSDLLSEEIGIQHPDVIADKEKVHLMGFGKDDAMRQRATDAIAEVVMPLLTRGVLPPAMCRVTRCDQTGEHVKFGLSGWQPVILDANDNEIPFSRGRARPDDAGMTP